MPPDLRRAVWIGGALSLLRQEWLTAALLVWIGGRLSAWWAQQEEGRSLRRLVLAGYVAQAAVTLLLYAASRWHWPIASSLQLGDGLWTFAPDARVYDFDIRRMLACFQGNHLVPAEMYIAGWGFVLLVSPLYAVWGGSPLLISLLNGWWRALAVILTFRLAARLGGRRAGLRSALLVAWWPSLFIWTSQMIRDPLCLTATLGTLDALTGMLQRVRRRQPVPASTLLALTGWTVVLTQLRYYQVLLMAGAGAAALTLWSLGRWRRERALSLARAMAGLAVLVAAHAFSRHMPALLQWGQARLLSASPTPAELLALAPPGTPALVHRQEHPEQYAGGAHVGTANSVAAADAQRMHWIHSVRDARARSRPIPATPSQSNVAVSSNRLTWFGNSPDRESASKPVEIQAKGMPQARASEEAGGAVQARMAEPLPPALRVPPPDQPGFQVSMSVPEPGRVRVTWQAPEGHAAEDWIGIYPRNIQAPSAGMYIRYWHTNGATEGVHEEEIPEISGDVVAIYFFNNGYEEAAWSNVVRLRSIPGMMRKRQEAAKPKIQQTAPTTETLRQDRSLSTWWNAQVYAQIRQFGGWIAQSLVRIRQVPEQCASVAGAAASGVADWVVWQWQEANRLLITWWHQLTDAVNRKLAALARIRHASKERAHTLMAPQADIQTLPRFLAFLPGALVGGLLGPSPAQWLVPGGAAGGYRLLAALDAVMLCLVIFALLIASWRAVRQRRPEALSVAFYTAIGMVLLVTTVAAVGTIARVRLQFVVPWLALAGLPAMPQWTRWWRLPLVRRACKWTGAGA